MYVPKTIGRYTINIADDHLLIPRTGFWYLVEMVIRKITRQPIDKWALQISGTKWFLKLNDEEKTLFEQEREFHQKVISFGAAIDIMRYPPSVQK